MNKIIFFISLMAVLTTTGCQNSLMTVRETKLDANSAVKAMHLPADFVVPATLPTTIQDPLLLEGWIYLYNSTKTCQMWDGHTLSGQQLAQYVIDQNVVITWSTNPAYSDSSWVDRGNTDIVYLNPELQKPVDTQMVSMVNIMAHEMFHRTTPFNQVGDTLYEEYWAFYVGSCVSGWAQGDFIHYNPLSAESLKLWFEASNRSNYLDEFGLYPADVAAMVTAGN